MEAIVISACLLGADCKYNGGNNALPAETLVALAQRYRLVPVCPEVMGGLPTPREPSERRSGGVCTRSGVDVTPQFQRGAELSCTTARVHGCRLALLKERSPSCGSGAIYDGSFTGTVIPGDGVTAEALKKEGVTVIGESEWNRLI